MNKSFLVIFSFFIFVAIFFSFSMPVLAQGYEDASKASFQIVPKCGDKKGGCDWTDVLKLVRNLMSFMLFLSASLMVLAFLYAGFLYITAFGETGKVEQAHNIFSKVLTGFLFVFLGWLIVATILKTLGVANSFSLINFNSVTEFKK